MNKNRDILEYERIKTAVGDLEIGMYVAELDIPWLDSPFLMQGFEIKSQDEIDQLHQCCKFVYVEVLRRKNYSVSTSEVKKLTFWQKIAAFFARLFGKKQPQKQAEPEAFSKEWIKKREPPKRQATFAEEFVNAESLHFESRQAVKHFMDDIYSGKSVDANVAKQVVEDCVNSILRVPEAMLWMSQLKHRDAYTAEHSMNVCVLAIALGRHLSLPYKALNELGLCGMMHDMGKIKVPLEILNKPGKFEPEEFEVMKSHTTKGWELLRDTDGMIRSAVEVAHSHHERLDGAGYPRKLHASQISPYSKMVAIVDMYDALTSDRIYQKGRSHLEAINIMTGVKGQHLDVDLVEKFIECVGVYPPGCLVSLSNGEIGIVTEINYLQRLRPKLVIIRDSDKQVCEERELDLSLVMEDARGELLKINSVITAGDHNIDIEHYRQRGVFNS